MKLISNILNGIAFCIVITIMFFVAAGVGVCEFLRGEYRN